jgi:hypothetical protein
VAFLHWTNSSTPAVTILGTQRLAEKPAAHVGHHSEVVARRAVVLLDQILVKQAALAASVPSRALQRSSTRNRQLLQPPTCRLPGDPGQ